MRMLQYNTTNISALKMVYLYKEMGIKNCNFILQLNNEKLLNIDPFSETLTDLEKAMIVKEIIENPWYYFREIVRIPSPGGLVRFEFHRGTVAILWCLLNDLSPYTILPRQTYKTGTFQSYYSHLFYWGTTNTTISIMAHEDAISKKNLRGIKDIRDALPKWLNLFDRKKDIDNEKEMNNKSAGNRISAKAPARSLDTARKLGRGLSTPCQWKDEIAFVSFNYEIEDSISFAYSKSKEAAKSAGAPYHRAMSTTAGFLNTSEGVWAHKMLEASADFTELFFDMDIGVVRDIISNSSTNDFVRIEFMYYDLGKGSTYLDEMKKLLANSLNPEDALDREVLNIWKDVSTEHPLGQERINKLNGLKRNPIDIMIINDTYSMRIYKDLDKFDITKPLIGGLDLSGNLKGDFSVLTVLDPTDFSVVAVLRTNSQSTTLFGIAIVGIMLDLFTGLILFGERNYNAAILDNIVSLLPNANKRVYHEKPGVPGIFNSKKIRPILFNVILRPTIDDYGDRICDKTIISEIEGIVRGRNGRLDHKPGYNDDALISYLLILYFLLYIKDKHKYMDESIILSKFNKSSNLDVMTPKRRINRSRKLKTSGYLNIKESNMNFNNIDDIANAFHKNMSSKINGITRASMEMIKSDNVEDFDILGTEDSISDAKLTISDIKKNSEVKDFNKRTTMNSNINTKSTDKEDFKSVIGW